MNARLPVLATLGVVALASGAGSLGCGHSGQRLKDAASADLNCPPSRLHILGASRVKDVNGCGHSATYQYEDGEWYMTIRDGQPVSSQPPPRTQAPSQLPPSSQTSPGGQPQSAQPAGVTGTPSAPPPSQPPPAAGGKSL